MQLSIYKDFEQCVSKIFNEIGFSIESNVLLNDKKTEIDLIATRENEIYCVEIKYTQGIAKVIRKSAEKIVFAAQKKAATPVLVCATVVPQKLAEEIQILFPNLILLDIANLLFLVADLPGLRNELVALLPVNVDSIEPEECTIHSDVLQHSDNTHSLIMEMQNCVDGKSGARNFEQLCKKLLENVFSDDLALWKDQQQSTGDLYRFDLLCRIKDGNTKTIWSIFERYFNSKYIIFEFKNYSEQITQKEIYTTEKYLYAKALRSVAIIIAKNGFDDNAKRAADGCLRENGKLIMLLSVQDVIHMNEMKANQEDPSDYLLSMLDELLLGLGK